MVARENLAIGASSASAHAFTITTKLPIVNSAEIAALGSTGHLAPTHAPMVGIRDTKPSQMTTRQELLSLSAESSIVAVAEPILRPSEARSKQVAGSYKSLMKFTKRFVKML